MSSPPAPAALSRRRADLGAAVYGAFAFLVFAATIVYCPGFLGGFPVPHDATDGPPTPGLRAAAIDLALLALFGLHHSLFAREGVKRRLGRIVPETVERSTYVLVSSLLLAAVYAFWRPIPAVLWSLDAPGSWLARVVMAVGWLTSLASAHCLGHQELFGLRQALAGRVGSMPAAPTLRTDRLHGVVRHPMYLGFLLGVWFLPTMTVGHLFFAAGTSIYLFVGLVFEERDLERRFGDAYREYRARVPAFVPRLAPRRAG